MDLQKSWRRRAAGVLTLALAAALALPGGAVYAMPIQTANAQESVYLINAVTGEVLLDQNSGQQRCVASLTKMMTALLLLESGKDLNGEVTVPTALTQEFRDIQNANGSTMHLRIGETVRRIALLYGLLVASANDAASVIASDVSGGNLPACVSMMNQKAQELGCTGTHFVNPNGLHDPNHYTTAWDIYLFTREAMKNETFMKICGTASYVVPATNMSEERELYTTNSLISNWRIMGYQYDGADGIKTGSTEESGYCLVSSAKRSGRRLVAVVLGCKGNGATVESFSESAKLYNWAYNNFSMRQVAATDELYRQPVALSKQTDTVMLYPAQSVEAFLPKDAKDEDIRKSVTLKEDVVNAPVTAGQELGTLTITYNDQVCAEVPLLAQADVSASRFLVAKAAVEAFFAKTWVKLALVAVVVLVIVFILWLKLGRRSRQYGSRGGKRRQRRAYRGRRRW